MGFTSRRWHFPFDKLNDSELGLMARLIAQDLREEKSRGQLAPFLEEIADRLIGPDKPAV